MRGGQGRQPLDVPPRWKGLGNTACSLECLASCLKYNGCNSSGGGYSTLPLKPRFLVASDRSQVARRRVRLDLADSGIIEQQLNQSSNQLGSQAFASCDAEYLPVTGSIPRTPDRFLLPTIRPRFQEQRTTGHTQSALYLGIANGNSCAKTLGKYCRQQVSGVLLLRPTTRR